MAQNGVATDDTFLSLPLLKFSYTTTAAVQGKLNWTHLPQRDNIYMVFDSIRSQDVQGRLINTRFMKVVRAGETLEYVSLEDLVSQAYADEGRDGPKPLSDSNRVVIMIVKKPLIALRYRLADGKVRRIQMNFCPESGYDQALRIFQTIQIPIRDRNEPQLPAESQNVSRYSQVPTPTPGLQYSQPYPPRMYGILPHETSTLAIQGLGQAIQPSAPAIQSSVQPTGYLAEAPHALSVNHQDLPQPLQNESSVFHRHLEGSFPSLRGSPLRSYDCSTPIPLPLHQTASRPVSASHGLLEGRRIKQRSKPLYNILTPTANFAPRPPNNPSAAQSHVDMGPPIKQDRPFTSPTQYSQHDTLASLLPPKRVLPFPTIQPDRTKAEPVGDDRHEDTPRSKPSDVAADKTIGTKAKSKMQKGKAVKPATKPVSKSAKSVSSSALVGTTKISKLPPSLTPKRIAKSSRPSKPKKVSPGSNRKASPIVEDDIGESSDPPPSPSKSALLKDSRATTAKARRAVLSGAVNETFMEGVEDFVRKHAQRPAAVAPVPAPISDLQEYARMPETKRLEALDDLIVQYIKDDNFVTLCEDVEKCWKRIGLNA